MKDIGEAVNRRYLLVVFLLALAAASLLRIPALTSSLRTDSLSHYIDFTQKGRTPADAFTSNYTDHPSYYRPLFESFYWAQATIEANPLLMRILSALLLALGALFVAILTKHLTGKRRLGLYAGLFYALHPLIGFLVLRPINQVNILAVNLMMASVLLFLFAHRATGKTKRYLAGTTSLIAAFGALLCKEVALPLPAVIFLVACRENLVKEHSWSKAIKNAFLMTIPFILVLGGYLLLRIQALGGLKFVGEQGGTGLISIVQFGIGLVWPPGFEHLLGSRLSGALEGLVFVLPAFVCLGIAVLSKPWHQWKDKENARIRKMLTHPPVIAVLVCLPFLVPLYGRFSDLDTSVFLPSMSILVAWAVNWFLGKRRRLAVGITFIALLYYAVVGVMESLLWARTARTNDRITYAMEKELPLIIEAGGFINLAPPSHYQDRNPLTRLNPMGVTFSLADHLQTKTLEEIICVDAARWQKADPDATASSIDVVDGKIILTISEGNLAPAPEGTNSAGVPLDVDITDKDKTLLLNHPPLPTFGLQDGDQICVFWCKDEI
ncbi:hypothetical protein KAU45_11495 [bacterium]|nr:hypothetical protein [bacterium]